MPHTDTAIEAAKRAKVRAPPAWHVFSLYRHGWVARARLAFALVCRRFDVVLFTRVLFLFAFVLCGAQAARQQRRLAEEAKEAMAKTSAAPTELGAQVDTTAAAGDADGTVGSDDEDYDN
jgi:hypothetical protein